MKRHLRYLGPLFVLLLFAGAIWLLSWKIKDFNYQKLVQSIHAIPWTHLAAAVGLTILNYLVLIFYDLLNIRYLGHPFPVRKIALGSLTSYMVSNTFGMLLGGTAVRYRLYSAWGLSAVEVAELIALLGLTFWLGVFVLAGVLFVIAPLPIPEVLQPYIPLQTVGPAGIALLVFVATYLLFSAFWRRPIRIGQWKSHIPPLKISLYQILISSADVTIAGGVLYVLLPPDLGASFPWVLGVYLLGVVFSVITHVPGQLAVLDVVIMEFLGNNEPVGAALAVYRAVYTFFPLLIAAVLLGAHELVLRKQALRKAFAALSDLAPATVPRLLSLLTFAAGAMLVFSAAVPSSHFRMNWLRDVLPLPVVEVSHFVASLVGVVLMLLARGLHRRLGSAYWLTVAVLAGGCVASLFKGLAYEEALVMLVMLIALAPCRREFYRKGALLGQPSLPGWVTAVVVVLLGSLWFGLFAYKKAVYSSDLFWHFAFRADAPRFLRATLGATALALIFILAMSLRRAVRRPGPPSAAEMEVVRRIVAASPDPHAKAALLGDKTVLLNEEQDGLIAYAIQGRSWIAWGDPVGADRAKPELVWQFCDLCNRFDGWPVFYRVSEACLPTCLDLGLTPLKLGEEARVPLAGFSLDSGNRQPLRQTWQQLRNDGCSLEVFAPGAAAALTPQLKQVSDAWLAEKHVKADGTANGRLDAAYSALFPVAVVRQGERILASAGLWCAGGKEEVAIDLVQWLPDAPPGAVEYLLVELMEWARAEGYRWFNLGLTPSAGVEDQALALYWDRVGALLLPDAAGRDWRGLRQSREQFQPEWTPQYLASPAGLSLPRIVADVATIAVQRGG